MDLRRLLEVVRSACGAAGARWAVIGGVAMNAYGHARTTFDFDVASEDRHRGEILRRVEGGGFRLLNDVPAFSNLLHDDRDLGRLDFLWMNDATADVVFRGARVLTVPDGPEVLVPAPEHLISMKVRGIQNQPTRVFRDAADLQHLLRIPGLDDNQVREAFAKSDLLDLLERLRALG